jgi:hypothetical protein
MPDDPLDYPELPPPRRVDLEKIQLSHRWALSDRLLEQISDAGLMDAKLQEWREAWIHQTIYEVTGFIWGRKHQWCKFAAPATWWDHVKERFFPAWLVRRFPIKYREEIVEAIAMLPDLDLRIPSHQTTIAIQTVPGATYSRKVLPWRVQQRPAS